MPSDKKQPDSPAGKAALDARFNENDKRARALQERISDLTATSVEICLRADDITARAFAALAKSRAQMDALSDTVPRPARQGSKRPPRETGED